ncbi:MAG: hypothetical protein HY070_00380 [Chloroflexi bacterium]|nr:hypothetical protein [Chloroflexota bacterium]MBI3740236.1 hypothetical protein [Chloroflexota bacterium]
MNPEAGLAWFRIALFISLTSGALILFQKPDTAEFIISVTSLVIGLIFIALIALIVRRNN